MTARWITADVFDGLATLETGSVDLVVTSPPFLALRSYLPADHPDKGKEIGSEATPAEFIDVMLKVTAELRRVLTPHGSICIELGDTYAGSGGGGGDYLPGGWREGQQQFAGSEASMRESNAAHWRQKNSARRNRPADVEAGILPPLKRPGPNERDNIPGWPLAKSRTLIPQLYQIALAYGINPLTGSSSPAGQWRIRNVVTWARPNPPVGALGDKWRPATSDLIVACVSPKRYWDDLATRKPHTTPDTRADVRHPRQLKGRLGTDGENGLSANGNNPSGAPLLDYWEIPLLEGEEPKQYGPKPPKPKGMSRHREGEPPRTDLPSQQRDGNWRTLPQTNDDPNGPGAPLLDYWEIPPGGYKGSHYAVFPEELVVPCVKAMCPEKVCRVCGEPSRRIVEASGAYQEIKSKAATKPGGVGHNDSVGWTGLSPRSTMSDGSAFTGAQFETTGWTSCGHDDYRPGLVLDPFAGSGTTLSVATGHGHDAIGIDLDPRNADLARERIGPFLFEETRMQ